ncbi:hypothetical protein ABIB83_008555 [Bradyrhizobium sp. I1.8.5]
MDQPVHSDEAPPGWRRACAAPLRQAFPLGATWDGLGVNFALFSAHATKVELCLFDDAGETEIERIELPEYTDEVWHGRHTVVVLAGAPRPRPTTPSQPPHLGKA